MRPARNFEYNTRTPRGSFPAAYDCRLARPTPSHSPSGQEHPSISWAVVSCCYKLYILYRCPQLISEVHQTFVVGVVFYISFCSPRFDHHRSISKLRCRPLLRTWGRSTSSETQASCCGDPLPSHDRYKHEPAERSSRQQRVEMAMFFSVPIKHLEIRGTGNPGTTGDA